MHRITAFGTSGRSSGERRCSFCFRMYRWKARLDTCLSSPEDAFNPFVSVRVSNLSLVAANDRILFTSAESANGWPFHIKSCTFCPFENIPFFHDVLVDLQYFADVEASSCSEIIWGHNIFYVDVFLGCSFKKYLWLCSLLSYTQMHLTAIQ